MFFVWIVVNKQDNNWLGLMIGNSRLHWGYFTAEKLLKTWSTEYLAIQDQAINNKLPQEVFGNNINDLNQANLPLYLASVVPEQTVIWQQYRHAEVMNLDSIPLKNIYPTLGIDRALAVWGASQTIGLPTLVIDAGTALTFTGVDQEFSLVGGAILPGLGLQLRTLANQTAALPQVELPSQLPPRWAIGTSAAIESGVIYTILAAVKDFINSWWETFPESKIVLTGGDSAMFIHYLQSSQFSYLVTKIVTNPNLIFAGMKLAVEQSKFKA